jgi:hypothetical protein
LTRLSAGWSVAWCRRVFCDRREGTCAPAAARSGTIRIVHSQVHPEFQEADAYGVFHSRRIGLAVMLRSPTAPWARRSWGKKYRRVSLRIARRATKPCSIAPGGRNGHKALCYGRQPGDCFAAFAMTGGGVLRHAEPQAKHLPKAKHLALAGIEMPFAAPSLLLRCSFAALRTAAQDCGSGLRLRAWLRHLAEYWDQTQLVDFEVEVEDEITYYLTS